MEIQLVCVFATMGDEKKRLAILRNIHKNAI